jgi:hypothetical protein
MTTHVNDSGTWRELTNVYINVSGVWTEIQEVYVNDAGTWRSVFVKAVVTVSGESVFTDVHVSPDPGTAFVRFNTNGTVDSLVDGVTTQIDASTDWIIPNSAASGLYEIMAHQNSGDAVTPSAALDTWLALSSSRQWGFSSTALNVTANLTISIRFNGGATLSSNTYDVGVIVL